MTKKREQAKMTKTRVGDQICSSDSIAVKIAASLRAKREARGLSMRGLARLSGCSPCVVSGIENMKGNPHVATLASLCVALDLSWADLLGAPVDHALGVW